MFDHGIESAPLNSNLSIIFEADFFETAKNSIGAYSMQFSAVEVLRAMVRWRKSETFLFGRSRPVGVSSGRSKLCQHL